MYQEISSCRICGNQRLAPIISLGEQSLTGVFPRNRETRVMEGPLELVKCDNDLVSGSCGLVQLKHSFHPSFLYGGDYGYRSSLNQSMVRHLNSIVKSIQQKTELVCGDLVIDIGSNDSTLLKGYSCEGLRLLGIDPTGEKFRKYYPRHIELISDFFSADRVREYVAGQKAKVITSISMFYDLEDPMQFMKEVNQCLADDGIWVFEQSYLPLMLERSSYDTICHEHLEYYALEQIMWMADKTNFKIIDIETNDVNGGSFQVIAAKKDSKYLSSKAVGRYIRNEIALGLRKLPIYQAFAKRVLRHKDSMWALFENLKKEQKKVLGYGASTKGNVLLQFCGLTTEEIPFIAEVNNDKFGCFTPGTLIPIISEDEAKLMGPDFFFVLPWHFKHGILHREKHFIKQGGGFIMPLPSIQIIDGTTQIINGTTNHGI